ncbi:MAG: carboxypeptidase regulatory-like domain-containing protein [Acidobacteriota bacterium]
MQSKLSFFIRLLTILTLSTQTNFLALAQNATGSINGSVKDQSEAIITNANIIAKNKATNATRRVKAGEDGAFTFDNLQPGQYEVKAEAEGFTTQIISLTVEVGTTTTQNFSMSVGAVTDVIEVTGTSTPIINKTDSSIGGVVNRKQVEELPLNGRSFLSVAGLEPGVTVTYQATSGVLNQNDFFQVGVGGAPSYMTTISVDGARVNDRITGGTSQNFSSETVQEFQISTIGFDLSAGTVSSGAVNVISRSGGNNFHGSVFYFYRDHNLAAFSGLRRPCDPIARSPLCNNTESRKRIEDPFFVRRQYGGTFGGPVKKDRLFFFANYERSDQVGAQTVAFTDPLLFGFNHTAKVPFDQHLVGGRVDYRISDKHTAFLRGNIDKNDSISGTGLASNWIASSNFSYQTQLSLTSVLTSKLVNDFRFSYSYFRNRLFPPSQSDCEQLAGDPGFCFGVGSTLISFFGGLSIGNNANVPQDRHPRTYQYTENLSWTKGAHRLRFGGNYEHVYSHGSWNRNFAGTLATFNPTTISTTNPALYATLPASLKLGYTGPRPTFAELLQLPVTGSLTIGIGDPSQPVAYLYDKLNTNNHLRFYAQDAWQIRQNFTLNYGLAWSWEDNVVYHELDKPQYLKPLGISLGKIPQDLNNFDPALGFAWSVNDKTVIRTSLSLHHMSANRSYLKLQDQILSGPAGSGLTSASSAAVPNPKFGQPGQPAFLTFSTTSPVAFSAQELINYIPTILSVVNSRAYTGEDISIRNIEVRKQAPTFLTEGFFDENFHTPYTIHLNAGVQREIMRNLSVSADFVMRRGVKFGAYEGYMVDVNRWNRFSTYNLLPSGTAIPVRNPVIPACTGTQASDPKAQCSTGVIYYGKPGILSRYSALNVKVDKRFSSGFQLTGAYALARYTTYVPLGIVNPNSFDDESKNFGLSGAVPKHQFTFSGIWDLPDFKGDNRFLQGALNGWQLSSIIQMRSKDFTSVQLGTLDPEGDGTFVFMLPGTTINGFGRGFDADDIRRLVNEYNARYPAPQTALLSQITRAQRDAVGTPFPYIVLPEKFDSGDTFITHDLRLTRVIALTEKLRLNVIAEGFNIFNIANLTGFSGSLASAAYIRPTATVPGRPNPNNIFGQPTNRVSPIFGTGGPRAFQIAARLQF